MRSSHHLTTRCLGAAAMLLPVLGGCGGDAPEAAPKPRVIVSKPAAQQHNIVMISLCSVRADHMSLYGYERVTTPSYDALAADSIVFDHAFTQWPKTAPAFATLLSGKYGHTNGVLRITPNQWLNDSHVTLAEVLQDAGYQTIAFVSTAAMNAKTNIPQGFDVFDEVWRLPDQPLQHPQRHVLPTIRGLEWLKERDPARPFFLWAHYNNAHYYYDGGGAEPERYVGDEFYNPAPRVNIHPDPRTGLRLPVPPDHPCRRQILRPDIGGVHSGAILRERPTERDYYTAVYDAGIYGGDLAAGQLIEGLRAEGLLDDTIVVLVGDHGESLGEHNYYMEHGRFPYDITSRVPLMIRPAGGTDGVRIDTPVATFRLAPTLLDMVGLTPPADWEAKSLWPLLSGAAEPEPVFTESGYQNDYTLSVRDDRWKLIYVPNEIDQQLQQNVEFELYDWRSDPGETRNVIDAHPEVAGRLKQILLAWAQPWIGEAHGEILLTDVDYDPAELSALQAMGYVGEGDEPEDDDAAATQPAEGEPNGRGPNETP